MKLNKDGFLLLYKNNGMFHLIHHGKKTKGKSKASPSVMKIEASKANTVTFSG